MNYTTLDTVDLNVRSIMATIHNVIELLVQKDNKIRRYYLNHDKLDMLLHKDSFQSVKNDEFYHIKEKGNHITVTIVHLSDDFYMEIDGYYETTYKTFVRNKKLSNILNGDTDKKDN